MSMPPAGPPPGYQGPQGPQNPLNPQRSQQGAAAGSQPADPTVALSRPALSPHIQPVPNQNQPVQTPRPAAASSGPAAAGTTGVLLLGVAAVLGVVLGLSLTDHGSNAWQAVHAWGGVAVVGALAVLAPALGRPIGVSARTAWQVAAGGAGALMLFWVLFTLPTIGSNVSLLMTIGVAAGVAAVWVAPGRAAAAAQTW